MAAHRFVVFGTRNNQGVRLLETRHKVKLIPANKDWVAKQARMVACWQVISVEEFSRMVFR